MATKPRVSLRWDGTNSIDNARELARRGEDFMLELPTEVHHALFAHLNPGAPPGQPETVDSRGGAELLARVSEIAGFAQVAELIEPVGAAQGSVRLVSPTPRVVVEFRH